MVMIMDVDKAIAQVSAAGIELTDCRRTEDSDGWCLRFANGAVLKLYDNGQASTVGKGANAIAQLLDVPVEPGNL